MPTPVGYTTRFKLPGSNWMYKAYPGRLDTQRCAYCGERSHTVDVLANLHNLVRNVKVGTNQFWLVDACNDCKATAEASDASTFNLLRHAILVALRRRFLHHKGPQTGLYRASLRRRAIFIANSKT
jgi:hypothetical protein